jgi:ABC-type glycerol-3-phosphate transport system permease component
MSAVTISRARQRQNDIARVQKGVSRFLIYILAFGSAIMFTFPFIWTLSSSLKTAQDIMAYPPTLVPSAVQWGNYYTAWTTVEFGPYFKNSIQVTGLALIGQTASALVVAYGFARFRFPGRNALFALCLSTMILPPEVTIIPLFIVFKNVGWVDTLYPLWVPSFFGGGAFSIFLMRQFILGMPFELDEAALIDGASKLGILWSIILPNCKPALATVAVLGFIGHWNEFFGPLIFLNSRENFTIPLGLYTLRTYAGDPGEPKDHLLMAGSVIATAPIIVLFFVAQKYFVQGIVTTGIKG